MTSEKKCIKRVSEEDEITKLTKKQNLKTEVAVFHPDVAKQSIQNVVTTKTEIATSSTIETVMGRKIRDKS